MRLGITDLTRFWLLVSWGWAGIAVSDGAWFFVALFSISGVFALIVHEDRVEGGK